MWTKENEADYQSLSYQREQYLKNKQYSYEVYKYFDRLLKGVELSENTLYGDERWFDNSLGTFVTLKAKCDIGENTFNDRIYCCIFEKDCYYNVSASRKLMFAYEDKVFEIIPDCCNYELGTGIYTLIADIYLYNKADYELSIDNIERQNDRYNRDRIEPITSKLSYKISLGTDLNIISEVIKVVKEYYLGESRKKSNY